MATYKPKMASVYFETLADIIKNFLDRYHENEAAADDAIQQFEQELADFNERTLKNGNL